MEEEITYKPKQVFELGLLIGKPSLDRIYKYLADGRLTTGDKGSSQRAEYVISQLDIDTYNNHVRERTLPDPKPIKRKQRL